MRRLFILLILIILGIHLGWAQKRHALVIGIGLYEDSNWGRINGDTDVDYAVQMLQTNGFKSIQTLKNSEATKQAIVKAFQSLENNCISGDKVYIHFSGHGQQITDTDGDEENGYDEAWIPYDAKPYYEKGVYEGEKHLIDDEVNRLLAGIKKKVGSSGRILVVIDACHSGTATRDPGDSTIARGFDQAFEIPGAKPKRKAPAKEDWITISACQSYQVNWEVKKPAVGKLTWCLYNLRADLKALSNLELKKSILRIMQENPGPLEQTPDMTGSLKSESVKDLFQ